MKVIKDFESVSADLNHIFFRAELPASFNPNNNESILPFANHSKTASEAFSLSGMATSYQEISSPFVIPEHWRSQSSSPIYFHVHNYCQISMVESGSVMYIINNKLVELSTSDIIIINAYIPHSWLAKDNTRLSISAFYPRVLFTSFADRESLLLLNMMYSQQYPYVVLKAKAPCSLEGQRLLSEISDETQNKQVGYKTLIGIKLYEFSMLFVREIMQFSSSSLRTFDKSFTILEEVFKYISEHISDVIRLDAIAKHVCMNATYFSHYFKQKTGVPLTQYINAQRLSLSSQMLIETDKPIVDIAYSCGFGSVSSFYQSFKALYSISPNHYRNFRDNYQSDKKRE